MSARKEKKFFPGCIAKISCRVPSRSDISWASNGHFPFFDTWQQAHAYMKEKAAKRLDHARKELKSAEAHEKRVRAMDPLAPTTSRAPARLSGEGEA